VASLAPKAASCYRATTRSRPGNCWASSRKKYCTVSVGANGDGVLGQLECVFCFWDWGYAGLLTSLVPLNSGPGAGAAPCAGDLRYFADGLLRELPAPLRASTQRILPRLLSKGRTEGYGLSFGVGLTELLKPG